MASDQSGGPAEHLTRFAALPAETREVMLRVAEVLEDIAFGTVLLVVQDSKVVQIEMAEKFRLR